MCLRSRCFARFSCIVVPVIIRQASLFSSGLVCSCLLPDDSVSFLFLDAWLHSRTASVLSRRQIISEQISLARF